MGSPPSVNIARLTYLLVCEAAGVAIALSTKGTMFEVPLSTGIIAGLGVAGVFIWIESLMKGLNHPRADFQPAGSGLPRSTRVEG
jgi:hypothetical protein